MVSIPIFKTKPCDLVPVNEIVFIGINPSRALLHNTVIAIIYGNIIGDNKPICYNTTGSVSRANNNPAFTITKS